MVEYYQSKSLERTENSGCAKYSQMFEAQKAEGYIDEFSLPLTEKQCHALILTQEDAIKPPHLPNHSFHY
jgi:hypothetical protein